MSSGADDVAADRLAAQDTLDLFTGKRVVGSEGPQDARIVIVGEAPGEIEEREGRPFVGGAGKVLNGMLAEAGIDRASCFLTNLMQVRPPNNDFGHFYAERQPTPALLDGISRVCHEIRTIQPTIVVVLGNEPLKALTGKDGITHWRGSILPGDLVNAKWIIPMYHPAALMRQWNWRPVTVFDLHRAKQLAENVAWKPSSRALVVDPTWEAVQEAFGQLRAIQASGRPLRVAFDIEVETAQIQSIALSWSLHLAISIPFWFGASGSYWTLEQETEIWRTLKALFADPGIEWIAQNAQYDTTFLKRQWDIDVRNLWMDTMIAHHLLYPELPKSLEFQTSIYTDQPYYKDLGKTSNSSVFWRYNALDACVTWEIAQELEKELRECGLWTFYQEHVHPLIQPLTEMSWRGIRVDLDRRKQLTKEYEKQAEVLTQRLEQEVGHPLNPNSPKQVQKWLYEEMGVAKATRYRKGAKEEKAETVTADEQALRDVLAKGDVPAIRTILEIRAVKKVLGTYLKAEVDDDGRMRCSWLIGGDKDGQGGTETGRLSSRATPFGTGTNLQNVPHGPVRELFIPDEGMIFLGADLSQAEARVVAWLAKEERLIQLFESGGDIHRKTAGMIFGKEEAEVSQDERQMAKRIVHASNYGMGPRKFAQTAGVREGEARRLQDRYFAAFPKIKVWHLQIQDTLRRTRILRTPMGRIRQFLASWNEELLREAYAYVPQSTVSDILNDGLIQLWRTSQAELLLQVHDSVVVQCPEGLETVEGVKGALLGCLTRTILINGRPLTIPVDVKVGRNWEEV